MSKFYKAFGAEKREPAEIWNLQNAVFDVSEFAIHKITQKGFQNLENACGTDYSAVVDACVEIIEVVAYIAVERAYHDTVEHIVLLHKTAKFIGRSFAYRTAVLDFDYVIARKAHCGCGCKDVVEVSAL